MFKNNINLIKIVKVLNELAVGSHKNEPPKVFDALRYCLTYLYLTH